MRAGPSPSCPPSPDYSPFSPAQVALNGPGFRPCRPCPGQAATPGWCPTTVQALVPAATPRGI